MSERLFMRARLVVVRAEVLAHRVDALGEERLGLGVPLGSRYMLAR